MHDVLAHRLSLLATYAGAIEYRPDAPPEQMARAAGVVRAGAHQALDELREVITVLREDDGPGDGDTEQRPQPGLADLPRLVEESRDAGARVRLDDRVADPAALPGAAGRTAYRVVQEGLTNARKHAPGEQVQVVVDGRPGGGLLIDIRNPLVNGHATGGAGPVGGGSETGLIGLTERVRLAGGELDHQVTDGEFRLSARLPWPA
jgi:signal transduction histidine kinase